MNQIIVEFMQEQTCANICCTDSQGKPYCFSCFYAFNAEEGLIYFKSSAESNHSHFLRENSQLAGTILPDKLNTLVVRGIQFEGNVLGKNNPAVLHAYARYHKRFPMAIAMPGEVWVVWVNHIKMTDSSRVFGQKINWHRKEQGLQVG